MRYIRFLMFSLVFAALASPVDSSPRHREVSPSEYAVYSALIKSQYGDHARLFVIGDHTISRSAEADRHLRFVSKRLRLPKLLVSNYLARNVSPQPLEKRFEFGVPYVLFSGREGEEIFRGQELDEQWRAFYAKYPGSPGVINLSGVGFSRNGNLALVYMGKSCGPLCGEGTFYLLARRNGAWVVENQVPWWVS
jgi:hypothetical protein